MKSLYPHFDWPEEGFKEEDFTLDFIYDLHGLVGVDAPNEFANMLVFHDLDLYKVFCDRWIEYNETERKNSVRSREVAPITAHLLTMWVPDIRAWGET